MKILIFARCKKINGTHTLVRQLSSGFINAGHEVFFAKADSSRAFLSTLDERVNQISIFDLFSDLFDIDIIYALTEDMYVIGLFLKWLRSENIKVFPGVFHPRQYIFRNRYHKKFWDELIDDEELFVFMNEAVKVSHSKNYIKSNNFPKSFISPLIFDSSKKKESTRSMAFNLDPLRVVSVGRAVGFKKYPIGVIEALVNLSSNRNIVYEIYGDGELLDMFKKIALRNSAVSVQFMGSIEPDKLKDIFEKSFLFIGMGYSIIEAAASGVPAIQAIESTDGEYCYGVFGNNDGYEVGEVIEKNEIFTMTNSIKYFLSLNESQYIDECRKSIRKSNSYTPDVVIPNLLSYFKNSHSEKNINGKEFIYYIFIRIIDGLRNKIFGNNQLDHK